MRNRDTVFLLVLLALGFAVGLYERWYPMVTAPPVVHFPQPLVTCTEVLLASDRFPNGNYYVVPSDLTCTHKRSGKTLTVICKPR